MPQPRSAPGALAAACLAAALLGPAPAEVSAPAKPAVKRLSFADFAKDPRRLASLRKGVKKMRGLGPRDPRSWAFQANMHWRPLWPVYVYRQAAESKDPARQLFRDDPGFAPDPDVFNQCPHGNWWFLPWHRAYLYYFERILRWAAEDPELALPYWDYTDPNQRELPQAFRDAKVGGEDNPLYLPEGASFADDQGQAQIFPMRDGPLLRADTGLGREATSRDALNLVPFASQRPLPPAASFGGGPACDPTCSCGAGALESVPHNRVHRAVGGSRATVGGSVRLGFMGDVSTAARDPVFWLHHANIDRLWASWVALGQGRQNPSDPDWLGQSFTFYDVDKAGKPRPVTISVRQLLTTEQLGYAYDRLDRPAEAVAAAPAPAPGRGGPTFKALAETAPARHGGKGGHPPAAAAPGIRLTTTKTTTLAVPLLASLKPGEARLPAPARAGGRPAVLLLSLEGIEFDQPPAVDYDVYLNLPEGVKRDPEGPYHVGALTFFAMKHPQKNAGHGGHRAPPGVRFALSPKLLARLAAGKDGLKKLNVTFVPGTGTVPARAGVRVAGPAERPAVTIRQIRLLRVE
jgi:tyrosinase